MGGWNTETIKFYGASFHFFILYTRLIHTLFQLSGSHSYQVPCCYCFPSRVPVMTRKKDFHSRVQCTQNVRSKWSPTRTGHKSRRESWRRNLPYAYLWKIRTLYYISRNSLAVTPCIFRSIFTTQKYLGFSPNALDLCCIHVYENVFVNLFLIYFMGNNIQKLYNAVKITFFFADFQVLWLRHRDTHLLSAGSETYTAESRYAIINYNHY